MKIHRSNIERNILTKLAEKWELMKLLSKTKESITIYKKRVFIYKIWISIAKTY